MLSRFAPRPTYANVTATLALFLALGGGAVAAIRLPPNSVGSRALKNGAVTNHKLANHAVTGAKVAPGSLTGRQINASTLGTVPTATHANGADSATHASSADNATHATTADSGMFAFGQIRDDGSIKDASSELLSVSHTSGSGVYCLVFKDVPRFIEREGAVASEAGTNPSPTLVPRVTNGQGTDCPANQLAVRVQNTSGTLTDGRFSFIVP